MLTAAGLCVVTLCADRYLRYSPPRAIPRIELALALWGAACAIIATIRGPLTPRGKALVAGCLALFALTAYVSTFMTRLIYTTS